MYSDYVAERLGPARDPAAPVEKVHRDGAASLQARLEEVLFEMLRGLHARTKQKAVCLAGGVAFNCVANGKITENTPFEKVYLQPASGDAGLAIGAAYFVHHQILGLPRAFVMENAYWGPRGYSHEKIGAAIKIQPPARRRPGDFRASRRCGNERSGQGNRRRKNSRLVSRPGRVGAARPGKSQHRCGSAAPGNERNSERQNQAPGNVPAVCTAVHPRGVHGRVFREIRSVSLHDTGAYSVRSEKREKLIPAPTHVDGTGRLQTVTQAENPRYWRLIREFANLTGVARGAEHFVQ